MLIFKKITALLTQLPGSNASKRVVYLTVTCSIVLAIFISAVETYSSYRASVSGVTQLHRNIEVIFSDLLSNGLWAMDSESSVAVLAGVSRLESIDRVELEWEGQPTIVSGTDPDKDDIHTAVALVRSVGERTQMLGTLHLYSSLSSISSSVFIQFWWLLLVNMLNSLLVTGFALYLFNRLYTVHVLHIAKYARNFEVQRKIRPLRLLRTQSPAGQSDELQELVDALNHVGVRVRSAHHLIADQNKQLAQLLDERSQSLDVANQKLLERSRLATIGAVVAMVAHELRNPLGAIKASLMMAKKHQQISTEDTDRALNRIESCVLRCDHTIEDLRILSRRKQLQFQKVEFGRWIEEQLKRQEIDADSLVVKTDLQNHVYIAIDTLTISQVFTNLIENSIQAIKRKYPTDDGDIFIRLYEHQNSACVEIYDNGEGFLVEDIERVFDPLYTTKPSGFGMGLALSLNLVEEHGGTLTLVPRKTGSGAVATLKLPLLAEGLEKGAVTSV